VSKSAAKTIGLIGMTEEELYEALHAEYSEVPRYRAKQVWLRLHKLRAQTFEEIKELPKELRSSLAEHFHIQRLEAVHESDSADGTKKFLFKLFDGREIETVLIPSEMRDAQGTSKRKTLCLSTQVGCPLDCKFCATATLKLKRDLTAAEIILQVFEVERITGEEVTNIVYMGMGEPMLNYDNVVRSLRILTDPALEIIGTKRITVSTSGLPDEIRKFADEGLGVKLALSLHATTDELRTRLMPINKRYPIAELLGAMEYYYRKTKIPVTYEYIVFESLNDSDVDAKRLAKIARRMPSKVNIIPFHKIDFTNPAGISAELQPTAHEKFEHFVAKLRELDVRVMVRSSSGLDIEAACGQLALASEHLPIPVSYDL
jgi:23S rRNA (adenine2503-C2)-methyltransferase